MESEILDLSLISCLPLGRLLNSVLQVSLLSALEEKTQCRAQCPSQHCSFCLFPWEAWGPDLSCSRPLCSSEPWEAAQGTTSPSPQPSDPCWALLVGQLARGQGGYPLVPLCWAVFWKCRAPVPEATAPAGWPFSHGHCSHLVSVMAPSTNPSGLWVDTVSRRCYSLHP